VAEFCASILEGLDTSSRTVTVAFVGSSSMRMLNRRFRGRDYATDVLSFEYGGGPVEDQSLLGELVLAPEVAKANARRWGSSLEREIRKLLVHGLLHLLGYDHETDDGEMDRLQRTVLRRKPALSPPPLIRKPFA
jgi:probable rRNA maturation factor